MSIFQTLYFFTFIWVKEYFSFYPSHFFNMCTCISTECLYFCHLYPYCICNMAICVEFCCIPIKNINSSATSQKLILLLSLIRVCVLSDNHRGTVEPAAEVVQMLELWRKCNIKTKTKFLIIDSQSLSDLFVQKMATVLCISPEQPLVSLYFSRKYGKWVQQFIKICANTHGTTVYRGGKFVQF